MKSSILATGLITIAALLLISCDKPVGSSSAAASETVEGTAQTKLRTGGLELTTTGLRTSYAPSDDDMYAEFALTNVTERTLPFQAAVGTAFDQSHRAVFISTAEFIAKGEAAHLSMRHYPLASSSAPTEVGGPSIRLPPGESVRLALRVGGPGIVADAEWKVSRPGEADIVFVVHGIPSLF